MKREANIVILGAGVSGITTAIAFQIAGYSVNIYTKEHPFNSINKPEFSSLFPAASIIPHSVNHSDLLAIFSESESIFQLLYRNTSIGLEKHAHFELFSSDEPQPAYADCYPSFEVFTDGREIFRPAHPTLESSFGWQFDCLFADWDTYYRSIFNLFQQLGGQILQKEVTHELIKTIDSDYIINCAELHGSSMLGEPFEPFIYRGHLLHILGMPALKNHAQQKISFNFTPDLDIYSSENGAKQDVYFYQRNDRWILGGSRQKGTIDKYGNWIGEQITDPILEFNGHCIPAQILTLNQEILHHTFGIKEFDRKRLIPKLGYRFMGNSDDHLRLDVAEIANKLIVNNFGHGGSGVTLSWGCAFRALNLLHKSLGKEPVEFAYFKKQLLEAF